MESQEDDAAFGGLGFKASLLSKGCQHFPDVMEHASFRVEDHCVIHEGRNFVLAFFSISL